MTTQQETTELLTMIIQGDEAATEQLLPLAYDELRALAARYVGRGGPGRAITLQPTALVHEAYLRLVDQSKADWNSRTHFYAVAALAMRHVLIDHSRGRGRQKRGGDRQRVTMSDTLAVSNGKEIDCMDLGASLEKFAEIDPRASRVVELRFFAGMTEKEVAQVLNISERTVRNDWKMAQAWLQCELGDDEAVQA